MSWRAGLLPMLGVSVSLLAGVTVAARQPNVLVFMADDQGWGDLSCHGNKNLRTPNLDRLSAEGASFQRFYVQPVCAPTRAEFLTGRYHPRVGVSGVSQGRERLNPACPTIADAFRTAGFATAAFGKWHNGTQPPYHPLCRGFDEFYGFTSGHWGHYFDFWLDRNNRLVKGTGFAADDFIDHAIEFASAHRDQPFFALVAFNTPHSPMQVPDHWWKQHTDQQLLLHGSQPNREDVPHTRAALAMCENLDWNMGRVLQALERFGLSKETIVVFLSDNGPNGHRWNGGLSGIKGSTDEGGVRSPLFIRWPGRVPAGRVVTQPAAVIDLLPTLASLAGFSLPAPEAIDGEDLSSWLVDDQPARSIARSLFTHWQGQTAARNDQHLLAANGCLYDLAQDPNQEQDIRSDNPDVAQRLAAEVERWRQATGVNQEQESAPFTVGDASLATTQLPMRDAEGHGAVERSNRYPNCTYFSNWRSDHDRVVWDIEVLERGRYEAVVYAAVPEDAVGAVVVLESESRLERELTLATNTSPLGGEEDRVPRSEGFVREFEPFRLGVIDLRPGRQELRLGLTASANYRDLALWHLSLTKLTNPNSNSATNETE